MTEPVPAEPGPAIDLDDAARDATFAGGDFTGRYAVGPELGRGGMGLVRTLNDRASGRSVAMKVIRHDRRDPEALRRFAREARVQAQLEHPSIIPVYDLGRDPDGAPYFTMKRVDGQSLAEVLRGDDPSYTPRKLLTVVARVAMALEYAHRRQVVHRDLKPGNVMLGAFDEVYVLDWGLAQVRDPASGPMPGFGASSPALTPPQLDDADETAGGPAPGTPGYQAPELLRGGGRVDHRCDVYALGVILFEVLTGARAHPGANLAEVVISTLTTDGLSPRLRAPERDVAPELDALVTACTRLDPAARPARARDVARALDAFLDGDRDVARRRELAHAAADRAEQALGRARALDDAEARTRSLREVTTALALDPEHEPARRTLVTLLTEPSPNAAAAAEAAFLPAARRDLRQAIRQAALLLLTYALYLPIVLWMGVRSWPGFLIMAGAISAVVLATFHYARHPPRDLSLPWPHVALSGVALVTGAGLLGPLIVVPTVALITGVAYVSNFDQRHRTVVLGAVAVVVVPAVLPFAGLVPASYAFVDGAMIVRPGFTALPAAATLTLMIVTNALMVTLGIVYAARLRRDYRNAQRKVEQQAWQLAQLVPDEARAALLHRLTTSTTPTAR